jgi:ABC-2 type transport system ATP-binding protein
LSLDASGTELQYSFNTADEHSGVPGLLKRLDGLGISFKDLNTRQSTLEEIFVGLVRDGGLGSRPGATNAAPNASESSQPSEPSKASKASTA